MRQKLYMSFMLSERRHFQSVYLLFLCINLFHSWLLVVKSVFGSWKFCIKDSLFLIPFRRAKFRKNRFRINWKPIQDLQINEYIWTKQHIYIENSLFIIFLTSFKVSWSWKESYTGISEYNQISNTVCCVTKKILWASINKTLTSTF